jgi:hypothetical protein
MGRNARQGQGTTPTPSAPGAKDSSLGSALDSGFRGRVNAVSPASGVRAAPHDPFANWRASSAAPPAPAVSFSEPVTPRAAFAPSGRVPFDSEPETVLTHVGPPDPSLLLLARGELAKQAALAQQAALVPLLDAADVVATRPASEALTSAVAKPPSRLVWFLFGLGVGGIVAGVAATDLSADVYRARLWAASTLRSVRGHVTDDVPAPTATPAPPVLPTPPVIPTIDVTQLPKAATEQAQAPSAARPLAPPAAPGAPALQQAPGPR